MKQQSVILPSSLLLDPTKESLQVILTPYKGLTHLPSDLMTIKSPAQMVFVELNKCFKKAGNVSEGMLGNVIWGFQQCGYDAKYIAQGLTQLREMGYIMYTDANRVPIYELALDFDAKKPIWIRYTPKFTDLFIREAMA